MEREKSRKAREYMNVDFVVDEEKGRSALSRGTVIIKASTGGGVEEVGTQSKIKVRKTTV